MNNLSPVKVKQPAITLAGLSARTSNLKEQQASTQKIAPLWQRYFSEPAQIHSGDQHMFGAYYDYQSDVDDEFSVLVGIAASREQACDLTLVAGDYLKFTGQGEMPQCVVSLWQQVWQYFTSVECEYKRCYLTDYELYIDSHNVEIYIGIKPLT